MRGLALIGTILCGLWLLFAVDAGMKARQRQAKKAYKEDLKAHNYNDELQIKLRKEIGFQSFGLVKPELWDTVRDHKLSIMIAYDVIMAKLLRDAGYNFNPYHGHFTPLMGTDGYKDVALVTRLYEEYRIKINDLVDKYS